MAVQKSKKSKSRRNMRRSHHALRFLNVQECSNCGEPVLPHRVCAACGQYRGREILVEREEAEAG